MAKTDLPYYESSTRIIRLYELFFYNTKSSARLKGIAEKTRAFPALRMIALIMNNPGTNL